MHRSAIEWCDDTWNPITGCDYECRYCYARKNSVRFSGDIRKNMAALKTYKRVENIFILDLPFISETGGILNYPFGFKPTYHRYRLDYPTRRKNGCNILVGEMGEMFGEWIPDEWIAEVMESCKKYPEHNYMFLTNNAERYWELEDKGILAAGDNMWYGFSYSCNGSQGWASKYHNKHNFICVEPLLEDLMLFDEACIRAAEWVIVGAETGNGWKKVVPEKEWIDKILRHCDKHRIPVFMKDSLIPIMGEENMRREYPEALKRKVLSDKVKNRLEGKCSKCGAHKRKSEMIALLARVKRGVTQKQLCHMCKNCFESLCNDLQIETPDYEEEKDNEK